MRKPTLMEEAKRLDVPTRREVTSPDGHTHRTWRPVNEVAAECAAKWEERHGTAPETVVTTSEASSSSHATASGTTHTSEPSTSSQRTSIGTTQMALSTDLTKEALRQQCAQRGIALRKVARQQDGTTRLKRLTKDELQEAAKTQEKNALTRFFARKPGPALIEPDPAATVSGSAKKVCRIVQTPAWLRSKGRKEATRKRMAEAAAKEATRRR